HAIASIFERHVELLEKMLAQRHLPSQGIFKATFGIVEIAAAAATYIGHARSGVKIWRRFGCLRLVAGPGLIEFLLHLVAGIIRTFGSRILFLAVLAPFVLFQQRVLRQLVLDIGR